MHIAWLGKKSPFCGNVTYSREVTNALLDRGYQVSFLHFAQEAELERNKAAWSMANGKWGAEIAANSFAQSLPPASCNEVSLPCLYKSQIYTIPTFKSSKVLMKSLRRLQPDVVHASLTLSPLDFLLPEICQELNIPLVATFHPPFDRKLRNLTSGTQHLMYQLYAPFLAHYDSTIVFSQIQRDILVKLGVPEDRVAVIPNGVDAVKYSPGPSGLKSELKADRIFVYQGRIAPEKNVESLLKAWKQCNFGPGNLLAIVGDGPLAASLQLFYGEDEGIVWLGFVADEERRIEILRGADVFILPSLVEGLSLSLLEAMACGLACLATDAGADGEALEEGAGIVLNTQRVRSQLQTLLPLFCDHPEMSQMLGQKARQRALDRYTLSQNITELEKLYAQVLQGQRLPVRGLA
ncbi:MAG: glycosyltransferase family 1 protein [Oscillatoriales cyanobacterium]|uniref:Glycosyltransferase family 4 protein n=1 Tax=Microcoleus anatoxicus PTRS2 TaxID=2705321 RepID=A0ABU8YQM4_9CYAN|nr:MAG: glycosyltransferase family 1 protein [Oscillatoriales cyanobacterium]TAD93550.1 MAG: glycosyltransferase family 1 protein [Oscillatoriales cyanobacterium]TAE02780.1 MAG: glycosyltransferase family 1 protein [Oscillatoriales cyanobacterium]TAE99522.1 MAG: glycosyltransferase family 1 protein [Oscillatoriales cyanobacterium]TAF69590.1 MAG: glycosyltransferase family 1 protein [Oscillatoriales cyanobacterium]